MRGVLACLLAWHGLLGCGVADERGGGWVSLQGHAHMSSGSLNGSVTEGRAPARPGRLRVRAGGDTVALQWRPPHGAAAGAPGRVRGYVLGYGEAGKRLDYVHLPQEARSHSIQSLAPESVYLLSLQSANALGRSLPVYRAAQTKRVVSEVNRLYEPVDVSARVQSPKSVVITWKDPSYEKGYRPGSGSTRYYTVRYRERGENGAYEYQTASQLRAAVENLEPATTYEFGVRASQGERDGRWSSPHFQRTPESPPTSAPEDFEVNTVPGTPSSVSVLWAPPTETHGRVTEYTVSYTPALRPFSGKVVTFPGGVTRGTIEGLSPGERYIFRVRAANRRGQGPLSKPLSLVLPPTVSAVTSPAADPESPNERRSPAAPELTDARTSPRQESRIPSSSSSASSEASRPPAEHISPQTSAAVVTPGRRIIQPGQSAFPRRIGSRPGQTSPASSSSSSRPWLGSSQPAPNKPSTASSTEIRFGSSSTQTQPSSPQRGGSREYEMVDEPEPPPVASSSPHSRDIFPSFSETVSFSERTSDSRQPSPASSQNSLPSSSSLSPSSRLPSARSSSNSVSAASHLPRTASSSSRFPSASLPSTSAAAATAAAASSRSASVTSEASASKFNRQPNAGTSLSPSANSRTHSSSSSGQTPPHSPAYARNKLPGEAANVRSPSSALQSSRASSSSRSSSPSSSAYSSAPVTSTDSESPRVAPPSSNSQRFPKGSTSPQRSAESSSERATRPHSSSGLYSNERGDLPAPHEPHVSSPSSSSSSSSSSSAARNPSRSLSPFASRTTGTSASRAAPSSTARQNPSYPSSSLSSSSSSPSSSSSQPARPQWQGSRSRFAGRPLAPSNPSTDTSNGRNYRPTAGENRGSHNGRARPFQPTPVRPTSDTRRKNHLRVIQAPGGREWIVDVEKNILLTASGQVLQDIRGKPVKVKIGNDGHSIEAEDGTPLLSREGLPVFGYGRDGRPLMDSRGRPLFSPEGRPLLGLHFTAPALATTTTTPATTTTRRTTTRRTTTTAATTTTTTRRTTTTTTAPPPTTVDYSAYEEEPTSAMTDSYDYDLDAETTVIPRVATTVTTTAAPAGGAFLCAGANGRAAADCGAEESSGEGPTGQSEDLPSVDEGAQTAGGSHLDHAPFRMHPVSELDAAGRKRFTASHVRYLTKDTDSPCSLSDALEHFQVKTLDDLIPKELAPEVAPGSPPKNLTVVAVEGCHSFVILGWTDAGKTMQSGYLIHSATLEDILQNKWATKSVVDMHAPIENLKANTRYYFKVQAKNTVGVGPATGQLSFVTESENPLLVVRAPGGEPIWVPFSFRFHAIDTECKGRQYVKRTRYRKFVGVMLCNSLRYKIFLSDTLTGMYYGIGDEDGKGEDHCQFVDSYLEGKTGPRPPADTLPIIPGYYRRYRQQPVEFGQIGAGRYYVGWYECGVPVPGNL